LAVAQVGGARERLHLGAGIVDIVLAAPFSVTHWPTCWRSWATTSRASTMSTMPAQVRPAIGRAGLQDGGDDTMPEGWAEAHVEEAGPRHLDLLHVGVRLKLPGKLVGDVARLHCGSLGQHQRRVGRKV